MASRAVGEVLNGSMEVLSVGQSLDKRSGQTMLKTRVRFTSGPFKGIETLVKHPVNDGKKGSKSTASKSTSKGAAKSTGKAAKSTSKGAAKKSTGKAKQVKPADTTPAKDTEAQDTEEDLEELDLDFDDEE